VHDLYYKGYVIMHCFLSTLKNAGVNSVCMSLIEKESFDCEIEWDMCKHITKERNGYSFCCAWI